MKTLGTELVCHNQTDKQSLLQRINNFSSVLYCFGHEFNKYEGILWEMI